MTVPIRRRHGVTNSLCDAVSALSELREPGVAECKKEIYDSKERKGSVTVSKDT